MTKQTDDLFDFLRHYFGNNSFSFVVGFVYAFACMFSFCSSFNLPNSDLTEILDGVSLV